ncbi:FtsX-like permease family protein [Pontibacter sp. G13]|uniref:ABC transporter permease n=1 Tax=Pontibacter sp. G13 TaxID=3074898 RepID=UPI0028894A43|nr:FtsX-like permease family protein [Pontibacter sp. G13]WNJ20142.1 FtsX-like permease family protein [Pontibacter sp. G13]
MPDIQHASPRPFHPNPSISWLFTMAWRDSRQSRGKLWLFTSAIVLGVAALVAIAGFDDNLRRDIQDEARELLGADLVLRTNQPPTDEMDSLMNSLGGEQAFERSFASMVYVPKTALSRLVNVRALSGNFPYYGTIQTTPIEAGETFQQGQQALVDKTVMLQLGAEVGDSIRVGKLNFEIVGALNRVPGQNGIAATVAAPVYIPLEFLEATGLVQIGSRVNYQRYYRFEAETDVDAMMESLEATFDLMRIRSTTVSERKEDLGDAFGQLTDFLNLVGFVALLLGCVGVASAVYVYVREKIQTVAVLRCMGVPGYLAFWIFLIQILVMGAIGSLIGALLGMQIQAGLPWLLADFLPVQTEFSVSFPAVLQGVGIGMTMSLLFAMVPLLMVRRVSPLFAIRASVTPESGSRDPWLWVVYGLIVWFVFGFGWTMTGSWTSAGFFTLGLGVAFLLLAGLASAVIWAVRKWFPGNWHYLSRQALANLYRPNNQTLILLVSVGLGTALITTLYVIQGLLLSQVELSDRGNLPNMVLFDIQSSQVESIAELTEAQGFPVMQQVPVVTLRLDGLKGKSRTELLTDTTDKTPDWLLNREYRVTFRDTLIDTEEIVEGEWIPQWTDPAQPIPISVEEGFGKENMEVELGDEVVFNVQGRQMRTVVRSFRKVDFARVQTNFIVLFPAGVLEQAPQFHVLITKVKDEASSALFQRKLTQDYPNVSVVDLGLILKTAEEVLGKVSFVIQFMAGFSILTGLLVLIGSVILSRMQRIKEGVLLRTLGASKRQIWTINLLEYLFLGSLASLSGILLALVASWLLAVFVFETGFVPSLWPLLGMYLLITGVTMTIGLMGSRKLLNQPPLEVLRG